MASLYSLDRVKVDYRKFYDFNLNEGLVGKVLHEQYGMVSANIRNYYGRKLINHIGEWFVGKRVLPNEPNYDQFAHYDPDKKYHSRDGRDYQ
jgi:hypothetical protein